MMPITINAKTSKKLFKIASIVISSLKTDETEICEADTIKMTALKIKTKKEINKASFFSILFSFRYCFFKFNFKNKTDDKPPSYYYPHLIIKVFSISL